MPSEALMPPSIIMDKAFAMDVPCIKTFGSSLPGLPGDRVDRGECVSDGHHICFLVCIYYVKKGMHCSLAGFTWFAVPWVCPNGRMDTLGSEATQVNDTEHFVYEKMVAMTTMSMSRS